MSTLEVPRRIAGLGTAALAIALLLTSCDPVSEHRVSPAEPLPPPPLMEGLSSFLTEEAWVQLGESERFDVSSVDFPGEELIPPDRAAGLARAFMRVMGPWNRDRLEAEHGATIDFDRLVPESRVIAAQSPNRPFGPNVPLFVRKNWGPYYLVTLSEGGVPKVVVAVSALASDLEVEAGRVRATGGGPYGNEFRWYGVPLGGEGVVLAPETAVHLASLRTGARIVRVPLLVRRGAPYGPRVGQWRVDLDRIVELELESGGTTETNVVYVDALEGWVGVPASTQPDGTEARYALPTGGRNPEVRTTTVRHRPGFPAKIEPLTPQPEEP